MQNQQNPQNSNPSAGSGNPPPAADPGFKLPGQDSASEAAAPGATR